MKQTLKAFTNKMKTHFLSQYKTLKVYLEMILISLTPILLIKLRLIFFTINTQSLPHLVTRNNLASRKRLGEFELNLIVTREGVFTIKM